VIDVEELTDARWQSLIAVNDRMNRDIVPVTDADLYSVEELWTYPDGYGDCEDIALAKRRELIAEGWDASALLMAVVRERNGDGHAVLMVRTDRGDLVLDNQDGMVRLWTDTPYQFVKRQSQRNAAEWVDILDNRVMVVAQQ
jgi:predicted transglutaminase-like cysteine proteinase